MTDKQYKDRRFVMFGDMGNIKQYVLDKKDNERFDSKWALMDKLNELAEENEQLKETIKKMGELGGFSKHMIKTICGDV